MVRAVPARTARIVALGWPFALVLVAWQAWISIGHVAPVIAPSPAAVLAELARDPLLYLRAAAATIGAAGGGLAIGMACGIALAVLVWLMPFASAAMTFPALLVQSTPLVAMLPIIARMLGYGETTVVAGAAAITLLPTFVIVAAGLRDTPAGADGVFAALGGGRRVRLLLLALPSAIPSMLVALRIAAANSILAAVIAEFLIGRFGLGRLFAEAQSQMLAPRAWGASLVAMILSVSAYALARRFERVGVTAIS